jgi:copper chaperone CopZ
VVTVVLKVDMHCDGCAKRIRASVRHYTGTRAHLVRSLAQLTVTSISVMI